MKSKLPLLGGIALIVLAILAFSALFTVHQTQTALVLQFGDPKRIVTEPGLNAKLPFIQNVRYYEKRVLDLDPPVERVLLADQKPLNVDSFARYRIVNPLKFFQTVTVETNLRARLGSIINSALRSVLGNVNLASILSDERTDIMVRIQEQVNEGAQQFGVEVVDLRIGRTDLPQEVSQAVYSRMRSEREREAAEFRAQGEEEAQRIRATADREATVIRAEAQREAEITRGTGEAKRTQVLSDAFGHDPQFFNFYRAMQAYEGAINQDDENNSYVVLSTDRNAFFRLMGDGTQLDELAPVEEPPAEARREPEAGQTSSPQQAEAE